MCSGEKCSDLVLLCPNQRHTLRLYRDAKSLLADEAGSTVDNGVNAVRASKRIASSKGARSCRSWVQRLIGPCALILLMASTAPDAQPDDPLTLNPDVPLTYTVQPGDTL